MRVRIVKDSTGCYEIEVWRRWWPFWMPIDTYRLHTTAASAESWARIHLLRERRVIRYLDRRCQEAHKDDLA